MKITVAESRVMEVLWSNSPLTAEQIVERLDEKTWAAGTIRTLIARLQNKGALSSERDGRRYNYRPLVGRDEYIASERDHFLDRLFEGRVGPLVMHLAKDEKISESDLEDIKRIVEDLEKGS